MFKLKDFLIRGRHHFHLRGGSKSPHLPRCPPPPNPNINSKNQIKFKNKQTKETIKTKIQCTCWKWIDVMWNIFPYSRYRASSTDRASCCHKIHLRSVVGDVARLEVRERPGGPQDFTLHVMLRYSLWYGRDGQFELFWSCVWCQCASSLELLNIFWLGKIFFGWRSSNG